MSSDDYTRAEDEGYFEVKISKRRIRCSSMRVTISQILLVIFLVIVGFLIGTYVIEEDSPLQTYTCKCFINKSAYKLQEKNGCLKYCVSVKVDYSCPKNTSNYLDFGNKCYSDVEEANYLVDKTYATNSTIKCYINKQDTADVYSYIPMVRNTFFWSLYWVCFAVFAAFIVIVGPYLFQKYFKKKYEKQILEFHEP